MCFVQERTSATVFPARTKCPSEWTLEYSGFLMTKDLRSRKGDYVCVDSQSEASAHQTLILDRTDTRDHISDVKIGCGTLPCATFQKDALLPCVVCSY
ncbi:uncharacterized protein CDAR_419811 [Caerostris darwini]|uniref:Uncharacterized protein n=1 Tax=Caerostris darwini TaxID=1538125 RepID=A0AAV4MPK7_9ARAC|nr:uncharacterized protein CDAR_419811 [Caerostris darwini]